MRGKEFMDGKYVPGIGITPAHAGKSQGILAGVAAGWDHPRTCGEKSGLMRSNATGTGSPPHMRGKAEN